MPDGFVKTVNIGIWDMLRRGTILFSVLSLLVATVAVAKTSDSRKEYGTRSLMAAQQIARSIDLQNSKNLEGALEAIELAIEADRQCQMAYYRKALILGDLGRIDECLAAYKTCISLPSGDNKILTVDAALNLALTLAKLKEYEESNFWFSQAIVEDPHNKTNLRWKAYRNMAINLHQQGKSFSAALAVLLAYKDNPERIGTKMVRDFLSNAKDEEYARILCLKQEIEKVKKRNYKGDLSPVPIDDSIVAEDISDLLSDPQGQYIVGLAEGASHYYLLETVGPIRIKKITINAPVHCASLAEGSLYLIADTPCKIQEVNPKTGRIVRLYNLGDIRPDCVAVLPSRSLAYFVYNEMIHGLNLETEKPFETSIPGEHLISDSSQTFIYSFTKEKSKNRSGYILVRGRPVFFHSTSTDWTQSCLYKSLVVRNGLMLAEFRDKVASNGYRVVGSPDGRWLTVPGGGGWRPTTTSQGGYGIAVFSADNMGHLQGFFETGAYPQGAAFNPVTGQLAAIRKDAAKIYHLIDPKESSTLEGNFSGIGTWSGNGKYLALAKRGGGISVYRNALSAAEKRTALTWWKGIKIEQGASYSSGKVSSVKPIRKLAVFRVQRTLFQVRKALWLAMNTSETDAPIEWRMYVPYVKNKEMLGFLHDALDNLNTGEAGIAVYQLRKLVKDYPESVPIHYYLADALRQSNHLRECKRYYTMTVRNDAGRTELTCLALKGLADSYARGGEDLLAIYCLSISLSVDSGDPEALRMIMPFLERNNFQAEARQLSKRQKSLPTVSRDLPELPVPSEVTRKYSPDELYREVVSSVVLIKVGEHTGTGTCIGQAGIIITNAHIVDGGAAVQVYPFKYEDGKLRRLAPVAAQVIYKSMADDIAVLKLSYGPSSMKPLFVVASVPRTGEKVFAMGNPGLGGQILEQSISDGIISSNHRILNGQIYLQHTAAVNPGNSGGPLLNDKCQVVGIVTLKASLENVSFAIPAQRIREVFQSQQAIK